MIARLFGWAVSLTVLGLVGAWLIGGLSGLLAAAVLGILEISLSFDNAVVNAVVLVRLSEFWQRIFLTVGIAIAVFGMRLLFPLIVVGLSTHDWPWTVVGFAVHHPNEYATTLKDAHPSIAGFGGAFLIMIFLDFLTEERDLPWIRWIERPFGKLARFDRIVPMIALAAVTVTALTAGSVHHDEQRVLLAGVLGVIVYLGVREFSDAFASGTQGQSGAKVAGWAGFALFCYLELLDASFSFDGVIGAFAVSHDIFLIAIGLGIGAAYIRSLTVVLVRRRTLEEYAYLEHGAHYAIGALGILMMLTIAYDIPDLVTGSVGVAFVAASFGSSVLRNRRLGRGEETRTVIADAVPDDSKIPDTSGT